MSNTELEEFDEIDASISEQTIGSGQLSLIGHELAHSWPSPRSGRNHLEKVNELIFNLRLNFHDSTIPRSPGEYVSIFALEPNEFLAAIGNMPDKEQGLLKQAYGRIWLHESPATRHVNGVKASLLSSNHLDPLTENIEEIATHYLRYRWVSPTLEWALVNSLIYVECAAFLPLMTNWRATLSGAGSPAGVNKWASFGIGLLSWAIEGMKLALTAGAASLLAPGDRPTGALIFVAITAARWMYPTKKDRHADRLLDLSVTMMNVHELTKRQDFNARLVRAAAYDAAQKGAIFSNQLYAVLDRIIARQDSPPA